MKKYSNIPLKERKRNADRVYRHELRLEQINEKRLEREKERQNQEYIEEKKKAFMQYAEGAQSDKEQTVTCNPTMDAGLNICRQGLPGMGANMMRGSERIKYHERNFDQ